MKETKLATTTYRVGKKPSTRAVYGKQPSPVPNPLNLTCCNQAWTSRENTITRSAPSSCLNLWSYARVGATLANKNTGPRHKKYYFFIPKENSKSFPNYLTIIETSSRPPPPPSSPRTPRPGCFPCRILRRPLLAPLPRHPPPPPCCRRLPHRS